jgi:hypothetical protein
METKMERHVRILASLYIITAAGSWAVLSIWLMRTLTGLIVDPGLGDHVAAFLIAALTGAPLFTPVFVGAMGLILRQRWARSMMIVVSSLSVLSFFLIITFFLGAYGLIVLSGPKASAFFGESVPEPL